MSRKTLIVRSAALILTGSVALGVEGGLRLTGRALVAVPRRSQGLPLLAIPSVGWTGDYRYFIRTQD